MVLCLILAATLSAASTPLQYDVKLPARARAIFSEKGIVITHGDGIEVHDPLSGLTRWKRRLSPAAGNERPAAISGNVVIITDSDGIVACSLDTGNVVWRRSLGFVRQLAANPDLLVGVGGKSTGSLLRLDNSTGKTIAQRIVRQIESLKQMADVILTVQFPNESDGVGYLVVGYRASDLSELWRFRQTGAAEFAEYDGEAFFVTLGEIHPLNLKTGERGTKLPPTAPVESTWGGSTRQLETTDDRDAFSRVRRNEVKSGAPVWVVETPFDVLDTLRDGDTLYLFGGIGLEDDPHHIAIVDWRTGALLHLSARVPFVFSWGKVGELIVATTWDDRLVSFHLDRATAAIDR